MFETVLLASDASPASDAVVSYVQGLKAIGTKAHHAGSTHSAFVI